MRKRHSRAHLDESCEWIRRNWNAQNLDVPDTLLDQWIYEPADGRDEDPLGFQLAVFTFGFLQYDLISRNVPEGVPCTYSASQLMDLFPRWQMKLALAELHRRTNVQTRPLPLFAFTADERVEAWVT